MRKRLDGKVRSHVWIRLLYQCLRLAVKQKIYVLVDTIKVEYLR